MNTLPVDRALSIYETLADRSAIKGTRERLSKHLMKIYLEGEKDPHRLTVHGLSYLRNFDREIEWLAQAGASHLMHGLVPGIHVLASRQRKTWMAGTSPAMTDSEKTR